MEINDLCFSQDHLHITQGDNIDGNITCQFIKSNKNFSDNEND